MYGICYEVDGCIIYVLKDVNKIKINNMGIKDVFFPIAKSMEALEQLDELERIKRNNYELAERLKEQEKLENEYPMKKFSIEVVSGGVILPYTIEARSFDYSSCGTYYFYNFKIDQHGRRRNDILAHFPINKTIIKKIEIV